MNCAYIITNNITGKRYVGITVRGLRRRWTDHLRAARSGVATALYAAIRKYGEQAFTIELVANAFTRDDLKQLERALISQEQTLAPHGYNMTIGGDGTFGLPSEVIARVSAKNRGRHHTEDARRRIGEAHLGHTVSAETRAKMRAKHVGKTLSAEHRAKLSAAKLGKTLPARSEEHCARISAGLVRAHERRRNA